MSKLSRNPADWRLTARNDQKRYIAGNDVAIIVVITNNAKQEQMLMSGAFLRDYRVLIRRGTTEIPIERAALRKALDGGAKGRSVPSGKGLKDTIVLNGVLVVNALTPGHYVVEIRRYFASSVPENPQPDDYLAATIEFDIDAR